MLLGSNKTQLTGKRKNIEWQLWCRYSKYHQDPCYAQNVLLSKGQQFIKAAFSQLGCPTEVLVHRLEI